MSKAIGGTFLAGIGVGVLAMMLLGSETQFPKDEASAERESETSVIANDDNAMSGIDNAPASSSNDVLLDRIAELENQVADLRNSRTSDFPGDERSADDTARRSSPVPAEVAQAFETHFQELAAVTGRTAEDLRQLTAQSNGFRVEFPNRRQAFADEGPDTDGNLAWLESIVSSQAWLVAGTPNPPADLETECRPSGCQVRLTYATGEHASAVFRSSVELRLLSELYMHDFVAAETSTAGDRPQSAGPGFDIFLWRRPGSP